MTGAGAGWRVGLVSGLRVGQAIWGVLPTWVWVSGTSPLAPVHPTSICDIGVNQPLGFKLNILHNL